MRGVPGVQLVMTALEKLKTAETSTSVFGFQELLLNITSFLGNCVVQLHRLVLKVVAQHLGQTT